MDVNKVVCKRYGICKTTMTIYRSRKTLSEQTPNNAYGIPITDNEMHMFMRIIELTEADWFQESIGGRIVNDILSEMYSANSHS